MKVKDLGSVLVVDDKEDIILVIESALEDSKVEFFSANRGREAMRLLKQRAFDVLLLDVKMPDISGFEICQWVKTSESMRATKVIVVSASTAADDKLRAFNVGADDYITKPFNVKELQARVKVMLNLRKMERDLTERNDQLLELIRVSEELNKRPDQKAIIYAEVVKSAARLTRADRSFLFLWDDESRGFFCCAAYNDSYDFSGKFFPSFDDFNNAPANHLTGAQSTPILDLSGWERQAGLDLEPAFATAGIPLRLGQQKRGFILISFTNQGSGFDPSRLEILGTLANQTAIALENSRLYSDLSQSEGRYRLIAENASDLILTLDRNNLITYINERAESLLGYKPGEIRGQNFNFFLTPEGQATFEKLAHKLTSSIPPASPVNQPYEIEALKKDGDLVNLEFNCALLFEQSQVIGLQAIGRDVTARKRETEQERMRVLGQMASGVAHDFNNVLANVLGHAQLLETEIEDPEILQTLRIIEQSAMDGAETVRRIQEFTGNQVKQSLDLVDLNQVVQSTIELTRPRWKDDAQSRGLNIEIERELENLARVRGKAAELREVLINLLNNAVDAMPYGGGKIGFRTYREKDSVCLDIWDTGKGMPPEVRKHVFEPFYTTKGVRGTGLGLSIVYGIISRYGGQIICDSVPDSGTTFKIRLPAVNEAINKTSDEIDNPEPGKKAKEIYQGRILAIDDEPYIRTILKKALSMAGFEVEVAGSGLEALALIDQIAEAQKPPFELIFSDLGMPGMSGWEVAKVLHEGWPEIPLVLITGWGDQLDPQKIFQHHVRHTVAKPFNIKEVVNLAARLIPQAN